MNLASIVGRRAGIAAMLASLSACLPEENTQSIALTGNLGASTLSGAAVTAYSESGESLGATSSGQSAVYSLGLETFSTDYPLKLAASGGIELLTGLEPAFDLQSVVVEESASTVVNLNAYSTLIVATAEQMSGGLNGDNVDSATTTVVTELNGGLTSLAATSPISATIDDSNAAELFRASTMLTEMLKRVDAMMIAVDGVSSIDSVLESTASDLSDGQLDMNGGTATRAQTSAVTMIVNAELALEIIADDLRVNGVSIYDSTDPTVRQLAARLSSLPVTQQLLAAALGGVEAALVLEPTPELQSLQDTLEAIDPDMASSETAALLDSTETLTLASTIDLVSRASKDELDKVNNSYRRWLEGKPSAEEPTTVGNAAPLLSGEPARIATVGVAYSFTPLASDPDGDPLVFIIDGQPAWAVFDAATGSIRGTPRSTDVGTQSGITITASDGLASATIGPFRITVEAPSSEPTPNTPPEIGGSPPTAVTEGASYRFTPDAFDADGDPLHFTIEGGASWFAFDPATGTIAGIPGAADVGVHDNIVITVNDGIDSDSLPPFSIVVEALSAPAPESEPTSDAIPEPDANTAPSISGDPPTSLLQGDDYYFSPKASDADGDVLSFGIVNKPIWASFDPRTGVLSGQPTTSADVGTHDDIVIYVSDGRATAELAPFSITVRPLHVGTATLSWLPPTEYSDGSPLLDLAGYTIYWGTNPDDLSFSATIENPGITAYIVEGLTSGTYHFTVTAFNSSRIESDWSNIATKTIQ